MISILLKQFVYFIRLNMGIRSSSEFNKEYEQLIEQYEVLQENTNDGLRYLQNKQTKQEFLLREISCHDKDAFLKIQESFRNKKAQLENNRHVTPLIKIMTNSQDQFCMTFFKVFALFQFPQRTLDDQINQRGLQRRRFQQKELWSILASCILGLSHLQKNNIKHSTLRSNTILISPDGIIKVYDPITTGCSSNYDTLLNQRQTPHIYISPEQVQGLKQEKISPDHDPFKTDIWTLGMIILQAGLLSYQDECYRDQYSRIHWETLQYNINLFQQTYSSELTNLVEFMLGKDERSRPDWFELEEHVIKVEEDVRGSTIAGPSKKNDGYFYEPPQQQKFERPVQNKLFGADKHMSQSRTPSQMNIGASKSQSINKIGIARSKDRNPQVSIAASQMVAVPVRPSDITYTRPFRSVFPVNVYNTKSEVDEILVQVMEEEKQSDYDHQRFSVAGASRQFSDHQLSRNGIHLSPIQGGPVSNHIPPHFNNQPPLYLKQNQVPSPPYRLDFPNPPSIKSSPFQTFQTPSQVEQIQTPNRIHVDGEYVAEQYKQGSKYQGYKLNGQKHGFGKFYYQDGGLYEGNWQFNKMEGLGKLFYQSDRIAYDGQWHNDQFSGRGTLYNQFPQPLASFFDYRNFDQIQEFWVKYQGDFFEDMKHGWGVLYLSNGEYFEGEFRNDYADGMGTFVTKTGNQIRGRWHNNVME